MAGIVLKLKKNNSGASAAEYALIIAILGGFVVGGTAMFGEGLNTALDNSGESLSKAGGADGSLVVNTNKS